MTRDTYLEFDPERYVVDPVTGEIVDKYTGEVVVDHPIDFGKEWRVFDHIDWLQRSRAGAELTLRIHDLGLHTRIDQDCSNRTYKEKTKLLAKKLEKLNSNVRVSKRDRRLVEALSELHRLAKILGLPEDVAEEAARIVRKYMKNPTMSRRHDRTVIVASLIEAAKMKNVPIQLKRIAMELSIDSRELWEAIKTLKLLGIAPNAVIQPERHLDRIVTNLGLSQEVAVLAARIIDALRKKHLTEGRDPAGIAAAAVYVASIILNEKRTQKEIARATGITEVTVRNRYRDIADRIRIEVLI